MTEPARMRKRPHTNSSTTEQRNMRDIVSEQAETTHKPVTQIDTHPVRQGSNVVLVARVRISDGVTLNMGHYSSFRRDVGLELDTVLPGPVGAVLTLEQVAHADSLLASAAAWVQDKLSEAIADAREFFED